MVKQGCRNIYVQITIKGIQYMYVRRNKGRINNMSMHEKSIQIWMNRCLMTEIRFYMYESIVNSGNHQWI